MAKLRRWEVAAVIAIHVLVIGTPVALYCYYKHWETGHYRALVSAEVAVADVVFVGSESGFREGCGTAVFKLALPEKGVNALPDNARYPASAGWRETPYVLTGDGLTLLDRWQIGLSCAGMSTELARQINDALEKPGSYVNRGAEDALIVIPYLNLVALVYDG